MSLPRLSKQFALGGQHAKNGPAFPAPSMFELPERVLQFGGGVFIRAFADAFIDTANREGRFGGRIVVVQSTDGRRGDLLNEQDGLFTLCSQGLEQGKPVRRYEVIASISRSIAAQREWPRVLELARSPELRVVLSNTTEVGIAFDGDDRPDLSPPRSFPGKLTAVLFERFNAFSGDPAKGLVVLPCELIDNNGATLRAIVLRLAEQWKLGPKFLEWLIQNNTFCNTLVDRIVTGTPSGDVLANHEQAIGYSDGLLTEAEPFSLWAIEGDASLAKEVPFLSVNPSIRIERDITPYRERKVRILNGTHTITVPAAFLAGNDIVLQNMNDALMRPFIESVMREEIRPSLSVDPATVPPFIDQVLERWENPFLQHKLINITLQSTSKMKQRVLPVLRRFVERFGEVPERIAFGFAAYLLFMRGVEAKDGKMFGLRKGELYPIHDDQAKFFFETWKRVDGNDPSAVRSFVNAICSDTSLWDTDLSALPGFCERVSANLSSLLTTPVRTMLQEYTESKPQPA